MHTALFTQITNERVYCWVHYDCLELPSSSKNQAKISKLNNDEDNLDGIINDKIFPNPTNNGEVFINTNQSLVKSIQMFDISGRKQNIQYYKTHIGYKLYSNHIGGC